MGNCSVTFTEIRFVIEAELTQVCVAMSAGGDCPLGVQGWHHKTFPGSLNVQQIMRLWEDGTEDPVLWPQKAPTCN